METLGQRIKAIRKLRKITQLEFSQRVCITQSYVSRLEANKEVPAEMLIKLIALEFDIAFDWLTQGKGNMCLSGKEEYDYFDRYYKEEHTSGAVQCAENLVKTLQQLNSGTTSLNVGAMLREIDDTLKLYVDKPPMCDTIMEEFLGVIISTSEMLNDLEHIDKSSLESMKKLYQISNRFNQQMLKTLENLTQFYEERLLR